MAVVKDVEFNIFWKKVSETKRGDGTCYVYLIQVQMWKGFFLLSTSLRQSNATGAIQIHSKECYMPRTVLKSLVAMNLKQHQII